MRDWEHETASDHEEQQESRAASQGSSEAFFLAFLFDRGCGTEIFTGILYASWKMFVTNFLHLRLPVVWLSSSWSVWPWSGDAVWLYGYMAIWLWPWSALKWFLWSSCQLHVPLRFLTAELCFIFLLHCCCLFFSFVAAGVLWNGLWLRSDSGA